jgi:hypothetical protein
MIIGQRMVRVIDGKRGVVHEYQAGDFRIHYQDRGERLVAPKAEDWVPEQINQGCLRDEEMHRIAMAADAMQHVLRAHTPDKFWEAPAREPRDRALYDAIIKHLRSNAP